MFCVFLHFCLCFGCEQESVLMGGADICECLLVHQKRQCCQMLVCPGVNVLVSVCVLVYLNAFRVLFFGFVSVFIRLVDQFTHLLCVGVCMCVCVCVRVR